MNNLPVLSSLSEAKDLYSAASAHAAGVGFATAFRRNEKRQVRGPSTNNLRLPERFLVDFSLKIRYFAFVKRCR